MSPETLSAQYTSTSALVRVLQRMAASKPTSWLFVVYHFLSHSPPASGPYQTVWAVSLLTMNLRTHGLSLRTPTMVFGDSMGLVRLWATRTHRVLYTQVELYEGRTSIRFAENQLSPSLIGLSPLPTSHPRLLQQAWVRPSHPR